MATKSPSSISRLMLFSTRDMPVLPGYPLLTLLISKKAILRRFKFALDHAHQPVEEEAHQPNGNDAENDMLVNETVIFLPKKAAHTRPTGKHFSRHNHQPGNSEAKPETGEHVGKRGRDQNLKQRFGP